MHPDHLPTPTGAQRWQRGAVRVLLSPPLRLVWTLLLFSLATWVLARFAPSLGRLPNTALGGTLRNALLATLVLWASLRLLEGKGLEAAGLGLPGAPLRFAQGYLVGAGLLTSVVATLWAAGSYQVLGFGAGATPRALGHAALVFFFVGVYEEVVSRGILFRLFEQTFGSAAALAVSALLFGLGHMSNPNATWLSSTAIALEAGLCLGAAYLATRSLWLVIGLHTAWNFFEGPLYGATVSGIKLPALLDARFPGPSWLTGGAFGPEAGLPAVVLGTGLGVAFLVLARRRHQFTTPPWVRRLLRMDRPPPLPGAATA